MGHRLAIDAGPVSEAVAVDEDAAVAGPLLVVAMATLVASRAQAHCRRDWEDR